MRFPIAAALLWCGLLASSPAFAEAPPQVLRMLPVDYPAGVAPGPAARLTRVRYDLAADGAVSDCRIRRSSGEPRLDAESCAILTGRARLRPAPGAMRGEARFVWLPVEPGEPPNERGAPLPLTAASWVSDADFPADALRRGETGVTVYEARVSAAGQPVGCTIFSSSGSASLDRRTCDIILARGRFIPSVDAAGAGTSGVHHGRIIWRHY
jgi:hypothetical protein